MKQLNKNDLKCSKELFRSYYYILKELIINCLIKEKIICDLKLYFHEKWNYHFLSHKGTIAIKVKNIASSVIYKLVWQGG